VPDSGPGVAQFGTVMERLIRLTLSAWAVCVELVAGAAVTAPLAKTQDKPLLFLAGVGAALVLIWIAERRRAKKKRRPGTRNTKAANRTDCNHTIYYYRYYRR